MWRDPSPEELRAVRIILLAAANFNGRIGGGKLAKVLTGSSEVDSAWLRSSGDFGKLRSWKVNTVSALIHSLERSGALERVDREGFPCLQVSEQGEDVLTGAAEVKLDLAPAAASPRRERAPKAAPGEKRPRGAAVRQGGLYEQLRQLRARIAAARGVPLFAVLTNKDLTSLVEKRPRTAEEAMEIPGIGERKAKRILPPFLEIIRNSGGE